MRLRPPVQAGAEGGGYLRKRRYLRSIVIEGGLV
ncbi:MAG: hypothetical protein A4E34_00760 [Methanoregula sp. PtaU1.Bin006]|nr:MAG: hypothetical protein A4E33_01463 [Methanoregula sp. PtaB.Bin085]OPY35485.1 MAG: hypothetical protein A4E34_00760 [Methanoregula sp. PtaU1.Bin006]